MTIKDNVLAAFDKLDATDDALWNKDGTPKLEAIRNAADDQRISRDEMIGSIGDKRRPEQKAKAPAETPAAASAETVPAQASATSVDPDAGKEDTTNVAPLAVPGVENTSTPDKFAIIAKAKEELAALDVQVQDANQRKEETDLEVATIERKRNALLSTIEGVSEQLSHADSVKRVQQQTQKNLVANKERMLVATAALQGAGIKTSPPASPLDAAYQARKKSPEQASAQAAYIQQQQARRLNERLGNA